MPHPARVLLPALAALVLLGTLAPAGADLAFGASAEASASSQPAWGNVTTARIRPGSEALTSLGQCTFNFLFYDASHAYIGTAAHCTNNVGDRVRHGVLGEIGSVVYDSDRAAGADRDVDFTLVRLDAARVADAHPQMLGFFAPTGSAPRADLTPGESVSLYGYGLLLGEAAATRARSGVLVSTTDKEYRADMPAVNGDSGAPLIETSTGRALGIISHYGINFPVPTTDEGPLMSFIDAELRKAGFTVTLATVPV